jgi:hypothetical protein
MPQLCVCKGILVDLKEIAAALLLRSLRLGWLAGYAVTPNSGLVYKLGMPGTVKRCG